MRFLVSAARQASQTPSAPTAIVTLRLWLVWPYSEVTQERQNVTRLGSP